MEMLRFFTRPTDHRITLTLPSSFGEGEVEVIVFPRKESASTLVSGRMPPPQLTGLIRIVGDIMAPAVPEQEWDALR